MTMLPDTFYGYGIGLRPAYYEDIIRQRPALDFLEIISENYLVAGGKPLYYLDKIAEMYPLFMHGVSLSIGSQDPLDQNYLKQLKKLADRVAPLIISDHLCWTSHAGHNLHDLLPLPYLGDTVKHVSERVRLVQDILERPILLENVSSYIEYKSSEMSEWEFYQAIVEESGCFMLLDINNIYVSAKNHGYNPLDYLTAIPKHRVKQFHLAGHSNYGDYIIDTHDQAICNEVWQLYAQACSLFGRISTLIERDDNFPPLNVLLAEVQQAKNTMHSVVMEAA